MAPDQLPLPLPICPNPVVLPPPELEPAESGPVVPANQQTLWRLWKLYEELEYRRPERVQPLRNAIAYLGGSLTVRCPIPASIREQVSWNIPVRR
jgi:hypothetical protein